MHTGHLLDPFELPLTVSKDDIDNLNHVNNIVYLRWVQEAAVRHWESHAAEIDRATIVWVVARHEIDYRAPAFLGDPIVAKTWVGGSSRRRFERHTEVRRSSDGVLLARARTLWCPLDPADGKPLDLDPEVIARFSTGELVSAA